MKIRSSFPHLRSLAAGLALLAPAGAAQSEQPRATFVAETFDRASGDVPMRGLGLVLELVRTDPAQPRLRLFGGVPGHSAAVMFSSARRDVAVEGSRGTRLLVGPGVVMIEGRFDASGTFEIPIPSLASLSVDARIYAQGLHTGIVEYLDGPLVQASHGIEIRRAAPEADPLGFDHLVPHLPADRELGHVADLAELLQRSLDSDGDSIHLKIELEGTFGLGIEVVDAHAGAEAGAEFTVTRTEDDLYEVTIAADVAALAGVAGGTGAEIGADGTTGYGGTMRYLFHSAPGAARGILGTAVSMALPARAREEGPFGGAIERMSQIQEDLKALREHADELEGFLWGTLDAEVAEAEARRASAASNLAAAKNALAVASWWQRPAWLAHVGACQAVYACNAARVSVARAARAHGEAALDQARAWIEERRARLDAIALGIARAGRIASAMSLLRPYTVGHYDGEELVGSKAMEVEAKLGIPVVDIGGLESGVSAEATRSVRLVIERAKAGRPLRVTLLAAFEREMEVVAAVVGTASAKRTRTVEVAQTFERAGSRWTAVESSLGLELDTQALYGLALLVSSERGVGRTWSVSASDDALLNRGTLASLDALVDRIGSVDVALDLQDRRVKQLGFGFGIDVTGNGGEIEIEAEWADRGERHSRTGTVAEGLDLVLNGPAQVPDPQTGTVVTAAP